LPNDTKGTTPGSASAGSAPSTTWQKSHKSDNFYHEIIEIGLICSNLMEKILRDKTLTTRQNITNKPLFILRSLLLEPMFRQVVLLASLIKKEISKCAIKQIVLFPTEMCVPSC
jgi:hypothetical protein